MQVSDVNQVKDLTHSCVYTILTRWSEIESQMKRLSPSKAFNTVYKQKYAAQDKKLASELYETYKNTRASPYIRKDPVIWDNFNSVELLTKHQIRYSIGYPFQIRQIFAANPNNSILQHIITKIRNAGLEQTPINIPQFLILFLDERRKLKTALSPMDLQILRYLVNHEGTAKSHMLINFKKIAHYYNKSRGNISKRVNKMRHLGVLNAKLYCNPAKLGYITFYILNTKPDSQFFLDNLFIDRMDNKKLKFFKLLHVYFKTDKETSDQHKFLELILYQIPQDWLAYTKQIDVIISYTYGYTLASLYPKGKISSFIPYKLSEDGLNILNELQTISLTPRTEGIKPVDLEILSYYSPGNYTVKSTKELAPLYDLSRRTYEKKIHEYLGAQRLFKFYDINYVGFPHTAVLYAEDDEAKLQLLKNYLSQFFHFRFYDVHDNSSLCAVLKLNRKQYDFLKQEISHHQNDFNRLYITLLESALTKSFVQKAININLVEPRFDDFFGLHWLTTNQI